MGVAMSVRVQVRKDVDTWMFTAKFFQFFFNLKNSIIKYFGENVRRG